MVRLGRRFALAASLSALCFCALAGRAAGQDTTETTESTETTETEQTPENGAAAETEAAPQTRTAELIELRRDKADRLVPPEPPGRFERFLGTVEEYVSGRGGGSSGFYGLRLKTGGLKRGAGLAGGIRFAPFADDSRFLVDAHAAASIRSYWGFGAQAGYRFGGATVLSYGRYRHMPRERFYGYGPDSRLDARSEYGLDETVGGLLVGWSPGTPWSVGARSSYIISMPGLAGADAVDALDRFPDALPTLQADARHVALGGWIEFDSRDPGAEAPFFRYLTPTETNLVGLPLATDRGVYALAEVVQHVDLGAADFSFLRLNVQSQQFVPFRRGRNVFAFREYVTLSNATSSRVPLYMQPTLGGAYTLRAFDQFRFRDRHALLVNAEYRWQIWLALDLALFADAGQVFGRFSDLDLGGMHGSYGAGLRVLSTTRGLARVDVARGAEGTHVHVRLGARF